MTKRDAPPDQRVGSLLAEKYRIVRRLGAGGMAVVYEAEHVELGRRIAIKVLNSPWVADSEMLSRFRREIRTLGSLRSEHVVAVHDTGTAADGAPFLVMELLEGQTLRALLREQPMLSLPRTAGLMTQVCHGLAAAHALGVVHRDLKPENLFVVRRSDGSDGVKVLDFGIAKLLSSSNETLTTEAKTLLGTPCYMSPERVASQTVTLTTDIHSVGLILYECLAGRPAYRQGERAAVLYQVLHELPPKLSEIRPELPAPVFGIVERALARNPAERFASAQELAETLRPFTTPGQVLDLPTALSTLTGRSEILDDRPSQRTPKATSSNVQPKRSRKLGAMLVGGVGLAVILSVIGVLVLGEREPAVAVLPEVNTPALDVANAPEPHPGPAQALPAAVARELSEPEPASAPEVPANQPALEENAPVRQPVPNRKPVRTAPPPKPATLPAAGTSSEFDRTNPY